MHDRQLLRGFRFHFVFIILLFVTLFFSGCQGTPTSSSILPSVSDDSERLQARIEGDSLVRKNLDKIERVRKEIDWFHARGRNNYGLFLNLSLAIGTFLAGLMAIIEGNKMWGKTNKVKLEALFILAVFLALNSGAGLFIKGESDRFIAEQKSQYGSLATNLSGVIQNFDTEYQLLLVDGNDYETTKREILLLSSSTLTKINEIKGEYIDIGLETNPNLKGD